MKIRQWEMTAVGAPLRLAERDVSAIGPGEALVRVAGTGLCHTDLGFLYDSVKTRHPLPLVLGHEIAGTVEDASPELRALIGDGVVVPAVMPCETCDSCRRGHGAICPKQIFPGNDIHGGFASHVVVPARALCRVPRDPAIGLAALSVLADAIATPFSAIERSGLGPEQVAIFVGVGGVGAFGVQIAAARHALVVAIDIDAERLQLAARHGATLTFDARAMDAKAIKKAVREAARSAAKRETEWRIFETSGTVAGQETAFGLLVHGAYLSVVGYTHRPASLPLSHLMAFDAIAQGNWGCLPALYPRALDLVLGGKIAIAPFIEEHPLSNINEVLSLAREGKLKRRAVLVPDFA